MVQPRPSISHRGPHPGQGYAVAIAGSALAVCVAALARRWLGLEDLSLVFMLAVLVVASRSHTGPAVLTAVLCFLAYNFFFIEPRYTLYISARHGVATVVLFLAAALLAGRLASQLAMQVQALRLAHQHTLARQELGQRLAVASTEAEIVDAASATFRGALHADAWIRLDQGDTHVAGAEAASQGVLRRVADGQPRETVEEFGWWFLPLEAREGTLGAIGLKLPEGPAGLDDAQRQLARSIADDIAQALLRTRLVADLEAERVDADRERLRTALLSSVSHDLRSPLAAMVGAAEALQSYGHALDEADRQSLLATVREEGQRLDRYIRNLLDMTRLGQGDLTLDRDWIGVDELIGSAIARMHRYRPDARFAVHVDDDTGPVWVQPALIEQALLNLIENAAHFAPAAEAILVDALRITPDRLRIDISDRGPGIPEAERERVFEMFYRVERGDRERDGTGLGLAICRGLVAAHGGEVRALARAGGGTTMRIELPLCAPPAVAGVSA